MLVIRKVERVRMPGSLVRIICILKFVAQKICRLWEILQKGKNILSTSTSEIIDLGLQMPDISPR